MSFLACFRQGLENMGEMCAEVRAHLLVVDPIGLLAGFGTVLGAATCTAHFERWRACLLALLNT